MAIELHRAAYTYADGTLAVADIDLCIAPGEQLAIVGQNGAGKTTAVKLMCGLLKPTSGSVAVDGKDTAGQSAAQVARSVGYVFQNPDDQLFGADVQAELEYMPRYYHWDAHEREERVRRAAWLAGIGKLMARNPNDLPFAIRKFVAIAAILVGKCHYVILDEPTAGLDERGMRVLRRMLEALRADGVAVITISHDMRFVAEAFARLVVMADHRVIADGMAGDIFGDEDILRRARLQRPVLAQLARDCGLGTRALTLGEIVKRMP